MDEPVAYINVAERKLEWAKPTQWETPTVAVMDKVPLYVASAKAAEWQGLTEKEIYNLWIKSPAETEDRFAFARAIEQALKKKNT